MTTSSTSPSVASKAKLKMITPRPRGMHFNFCFFSSCCECSCFEILIFAFIYCSIYILLVLLPCTYGAQFLHLQLQLVTSAHDGVLDHWLERCSLIPCDHQEGIRMPHAKFGPDLLKTVAMHNEQRNRHADTHITVIYIISVSYTHLTLPTIYSV